MKKMMMMITMTIPFLSWAHPDKKPQKDGYCADAGKHFAEPASQIIGNSIEKTSQNIKESFDTNTPILSNGMQNFGSQATQVLMQNLPQNIILAGAIAVAVPVALRATDAVIDHVEKEYSGEASLERIENRRRALESYKSYIHSFSYIQKEYKESAIAMKEFEMIAEDFKECYSRNGSGWFVKKLASDACGNPLQCQKELAMVSGMSLTPEKTRSDMLKVFYEPK
jgi:hypothetical protein